VDDDERLVAAERSGFDPRDAAEQLFASSALLDVLGVLCAAPERSFYVNELIRRSGRFPRSVQLALAKLERAGIVRSDRRANSRHYQMVVEHAFFSELASICAKVADVSHPLRRSLRKIDGIRVAFLRPDDNDAADLNVVVVGEDHARSGTESTLAHVSARFGRAIHLEFVTSEEWIRQARRERSFVRWLLEEPRRYLVGSDADFPGT
jgi:hypothetical protein